MFYSIHSLRQTYILFVYSFNHFDGIKLDNLKKDDLKITGNS